ncbi:hypothetical protein M3Y94_00907000 [Aphelenchoides besseyi]|nr:hypothetical protein M3Y94_00907000 [Aphelenchoides besseyi]KAI6223305.1 hypothetical protein M3Y95_00875600 [Aphelenchoides besseyi]
MTAIVLVRLLRIVFALTIIGSTIFFDKICSSPRASNECAVSASLLEKNQVNSNVTVGLEEYELEERFCALLELGHAISDLLHAEPHHNSEYAAWNFIVIAVDLVGILVLHVVLHFIDSKSRFFYIVAFVMEAFVYVGAFSSFVFAFMSPNKWELVGEPKDFIPLQYQVLVVLFLLALCVFLIDIAIFLGFGDKMKIKMSMEWKHKLPVINDSKLKQKTIVIESTLGKKRAPTINEKADDAKANPIIKVFEADMFGGRDEYSC